PNACLCNFQSGSSVKELGCSHQPSFSSRSSLPSPLTSPSPIPCVKLPYLLLGEIAWNFHGLAGSLQSGSAYPYWPFVMQTNSGLPSPVKSAKVGDSLSV